MTQSNKTIGLLMLSVLGIVTLLASNAVIQVATTAGLEEATQCLAPHLRTLNNLFPTLYMLAAVMMTVVPLGLLLKSAGGPKGGMTAVSMTLAVLGMGTVILFTPSPTNIAQAASQDCLLVGGSRPMEANLAMGGFDLTGTGAIAWNADGVGDVGTSTVRPATVYADALVSTTTDINGGTIDGLTRFTVGFTGTTSAAALTPVMSLQGQNTNASAALISFDANNTNSGSLVFAKTRNGVIGGNSPTIVGSTDFLGRILASPGDGLNRSTISASIDFKVDDAAPVANSIGGKIIFSTAHGTANDDLTTAATIWATGDLTLAGSLGQSALRVSKGWFTDIDSTNAVVVSSSGLFKKNIVPQSPTTMSAVDIINEIIVATYEHSLDLDPSGRNKLGLIAESVLAAYPKAAPTKRYPTDFQDVKVIDYDDEGTIIGSHTERQPQSWVDSPGIDTGAMDALLVAGIQRLSQQLAGVGPALPVCNVDTRGTQFVVLSNGSGDAVFICLRNVPGKYAWKGM